MKPNQVINSVSDKVVFLESTIAPYLQHKMSKTECKEYSKRTLCIYCVCCAAF